MIALQIACTFLSKLITVVTVYLFYKIISLILVLPRRVVKVDHCILVYNMVPGTYQALNMWLLHSNMHVKE